VAIAVLYGQPGTGDKALVTALMAWAEMLSDS